MIKLMVLIFFIAIVVIVAHSVILDSELEYVDELVKRGADINKVVERL